MYKEYFEKLEKLKLGTTEKVELSLMSDIDKLLDKGMSARRSAEKLIRKGAADLNNSSEFFANASMKISKGLKQAKELGSQEAIKFFNVREDEAKDFSDSSVKAASKVLSAVEGL